MPSLGNKIDHYTRSPNILNPSFSQLMERITHLYSLENFPVSFKKLSKHVIAMKKPAKDVSIQDGFIPLKDWTA